MRLTNPFYQVLHHNLCIFISEQLSAVPELSVLGPLFKSSNLPVELTESETEYVVRCVKHTFPHHMVFQVSVESYLSSDSTGLPQRLENENGKRQIGNKSWNLVISQGILYP